MADIIVDVIGSLLMAIAVSGAHAWAHINYGAASAFSSAAVTEAGIAVFVATLVIALFYNTIGWRMLGELI